MNRWEFEYLLSDVTKMNIFEELKKRLSNHKVHNSRQKAKTNH